MSWSLYLSLICVSGCVGGCFHGFYLGWKRAGAGLEVGGASSSTGVALSGGDESPHPVATTAAELFKRAEDSEGTVSMSGREDEEE
eukprot:g13769.t1